MTQTLLHPSEIITTLAVPRRRDLPSAPVLIRVPALASARITARPGGRRRVRREIRAVGSALLLLVAASLIYLSLGRERIASAVVSTLGVAARVEAGEAPELAPSTHRRSAISLSIEPVLTAQGGREVVGGPVLLSGQLLPADTFEESSHHGGH